MQYIKCILNVYMLESPPGRYPHSHHFLSRIHHHIHQQWWYRTVLSSSQPFNPQSYPILPTSSHQIQSLLHYLQTLSSKTSLSKMATNLNTFTLTSSNHQTPHFLSPTHLSSSLLLSYTKSSFLISPSLLPQRNLSQILTKTT